MGKLKSALTRSLCHRKSSSAAAHCLWCTGLLCDSGTVPGIIAEETEVSGDWAALLCDTCPVSPEEQKAGRWVSQPSTSGIWGTGYL